MSECILIASNNFDHTGDLDRILCLTFITKNIKTSLKRINQYNYQEPFYGIRVLLPQNEKDCMKCLLEYIRISFSEHMVQRPASPEIWYWLKMSDVIKVDVLADEWRQKNFCVCNVDPNTNRQEEMDMICNEAITENDEEQPPPNESDFRVMLDRNTKVNSMNQLLDILNIEPRGKEKKIWELSELSTSNITVDKRFLQEIAPELTMRSIIKEMVKQKISFQGQKRMINGKRIEEVTLKTTDFESVLLSLSLSVRKVYQKIKMASVAIWAMENESVSCNNEKIKTEELEE